MDDCGHKRLDFHVSTEESLTYKFWPPEDWNHGLGGRKKFQPRGGGGGHGFEKFGSSQSSHTNPTPSYSLDIWTVCPYSHQDTVGMPPTWKLALKCHNHNLQNTQYSPIRTLVPPIAKGSPTTHTIFNKGLSIEFNSGTPLGPYHIFLLHEYLL